MAGVAGRSGTNKGKDKPFRDALRLAIADAEDNPRSLRKVAEQLVDKAMAGDVQAIKEVADRLDGKVPQGIVGGDDDEPPVKITRIELVPLASE